MDWILIRGLGRHSDHWGEFPSLLEKELKCSTISLNLPGVSDDYHTTPTSIKEITDLVRAKWLKQKTPGTKYSIMAISLGGMVAIDWAARYPMDFENLITINSSAKTGTSFIERIQPEAIKTIAKLFFINDMREREASVLRLTVNTTIINDELIDKWALIAKSMKLKRVNFIKQLIAAASFNLPEKIKIPYFVFASENDRLANVKCSRVLAKHFNSELSIHPTAGHDIPTDDPNWVIENIKKVIT
jgi:homoserine acetyltransferase